ncbi:helix-turn-helix transcriptional regulator [Bremerella cremea]|uniref:helix-turn-helix transcriptional regulator n=2 Tax=Bremerella cremea TaxID=1031537 RepID=UPI00358DB3B7
MNLAKIQRLLKLLQLLQGGRPQNVNSMAEACGVSRRTIFRDLETLRAAGVPLAFDSDGQRFHIPETYFLAPTNLSSEEALSVMVLCHELGDGTGLPYYSSARRAATKLENSLPEHMKQQLREISSSVEIKLNPVNQPEEAHSAYQKLVDASGHRHNVRINYRSIFDGDVIQTKLSPYKLLFSRHSWYVIGRSSIHRAVRTFKVNRIEKIEVLDDTFEIPQNFQVDRFLRNAWHMIPEPGPDQHIIIRFDPLVAQNVAEVQWHKTQEIHWNEDGSIDFEVNVSGIREISWWILGYGSRAKVLQPESLQKLIADHARKILDNYEGSP